MNTLLFIDSGFLSKLSRYFGKGKYLKYDLIRFSKNISIKQKLECQHVFYYTSPPYQSNIPSKEESERHKRYEQFKSKISKHKIISFREGRCQRLKIDGKFVYGQKAVDSLMIIDLMSVPLKYPDIKELIIIACDSDFVPVVKQLSDLGIKTILYTYFTKRRNTNFSRSNELIKSVYKYNLLSREDFENSPLS